MNCRFCRLKKRLGTKYAAYSLRYGFCQRLLEDGVDQMAVAALTGHRDPTMINRVYGHMDQAADHLRAAHQRSADPKVAEG